MYTTTAGIGASNKQFTLLVSSVSSDLFVPAAGCQGGGCANRNTIGTADSATLQQTNNPSWEISLGPTSNAAGVVEQDTVTIAGYTIPNMPFGAANNMDQGVTDGVWPTKGFIDLFRHLTVFWELDSQQVYRYKPAELLWITWSVPI